jgi:hypothetical protein
MEIHNDKEDSPLVATIMVWKGNKRRQGGQLLLVVVLVWKANIRRRAQALVVAVVVWKGNKW